ncbi:alpha/beta hydrolase [Rhodopirellula europaea]|uniref:Alpha/beta hydrolase domain-containing protein n=1 Tax=Rhodopirellula europaea 6C TaxID=1263867 RepID=M2A7E6_9BACT|nr:alpha/beta hydrolase [Rhodopirellula europaea]EMB17211.1 alpha/beta hydrolase domain-containing protein [Rhodopirellula europaea 6C]
MTLHPQAQTFVALLRELQPPRWEDLGVAKARRGFSALVDSFGAGPTMASVEDRIVEEQNCDGEVLRVPVRIYRPDGVSELAPVVMFFHGGGWVLGDVESHDTTCRRLAEASQAAVVSVEYRRSPELPFPGPVHDCLVATKAVAKHGFSWGLDASRLAVMGDSAGGNLAAAVTLSAKDDPDVEVKYVVLVYPVVTPAFDSGSYREFETGFGLTKRTMQWFWGNYLGHGGEGLLGVDGVNDAEPLADLMKADFSGFPPTHVLVAGYDVLRDEGLALADKIEACGGHVTRENASDMLHGFVHFAGQFETGVTAMQSLGKRIANQLG